MVSRTISPTTPGSPPGSPPPTSPVRSYSSKVDPLDKTTGTEDNRAEYDPGERMTGAKHAAEAINRGSTQEQAEPEVKRKSTVQSLTAKERFSEYVQVFPKFLRVYINVFCIFLGILSIYWASIFHRQDRFKNMTMLVVNEDQPFIGINGDTIPALAGDTMINLLGSNTTALSLGDWKFVNLTEFTELAASHNNTISEEVVRQVHHQKYWASIHILPNTTQQIYTSFNTANTSITASLNQTIQVVYESGRHFSALNQYIFRHLVQIGEIWIRYYVSPQIYQPLLSQLNSTQQTALLATNATRNIISTFPVFQFIDNRPPKSAAVLGPSELGLIYAQLFSFHQFNFSLEVYSFMRPRLIFRQYIFYRILLSQINSLVLALVYALITIAFQVPINVAFGHSGFLVLWMFMYLFLSSSAGINENVVSVIFAYDLKELIAPWMIFNIVINIATTFAPFVLMPGFFKYGYAMPMYNTYEALKVVFFDTWKGDLGRNIGVLVIWIVLMNALLVINIRWSNNRTKRKQAEEKEKKELEKLTKDQEILQKRAQGLEENSDEVDSEPKEESSER
ncbi:Nitrosoguanidine resistance protein SNG1 [Spathaspora sp. JA1]|nr:Nitrosoguanidine resistance protein SNG1 [Spathaspora sp. JA1]